MAGVQTAFDMQALLRVRSSFDTEELTALYCRLSQDDALEGESNSIQHQRQMLERYARERGYNNIRFYIDDGVSGTTFQRPGFQQMISDIQSGQVRRVIVKDMSRFGRDYLQVGMYTEVLFPENDIHFIAVNDGVDSEKGENDFTPLRNLFNEWYARDTSKKIRAVFRAKGTSGKRLSSQPVYGYVADENGDWQEDPETAPVVREIFALFLAGQGPAVIARMLTDRNVPTPGTIRYQRTGNLQGYCPEAPCKWVYQTVGCILARREYLGHTVNFKTTKKSYKSKKVIHISPEEQIVYENTQPALIDQDSFDRVQMLRANSRQRHIKSGEPGLFSGLLFCADCGSKMYHHRGRSVKTEKEYYTCGGYSKRVHPCTTHHITLKVLKQLVMADLQRVTQFAAEHEKQFVDMLVEDSMQEQKRAFAEMQRTLDTQRMRHSELDVIIQRLYEDNIKGKLSDERFAKMSDGYEAEQAGLADSIQELSAALSEKKDKTANISRFLSLVKRNLSFGDLTRDVLNTFIQKIVVHEVDKSSGQRVQKIDIYYNFVGKIEGA